MKNSTCFSSFLKHLVLRKIYDKDECQLQRFWDKGQKYIWKCRCAHFWISYENPARSINRVQCLLHFLHKSGNASWTATLGYGSTIEQSHFHKLLLNSSSLYLPFIWLNAGNLSGLSYVESGLLLPCLHFISFYICILTCPSEIKV